jgi:putative membrane protein
MKRHWHLAAFLAAVTWAALPAARASAAPAEGEGAGTNDRTGGAGTSDASAMTSKKLSDGIEQLHAADQGEVKAAQLAEQNASSSAVKAFAQRMVTDHTQNDQQLTTMAHELGVSLEGKAYSKEQKESQKTESKFQNKTGTAFDEAYIDAMVKDHEKDAKDVKKLADQARKDGQINLAAFLDQTEETIQSHLRAAKQLQPSMRSASTSPSSSSGTGTSGMATPGSTGSSGSAKY